MQIKSCFPCTIYEPASVYTELISGYIGPGIGQESGLLFCIASGLWTFPSSCSLEGQSVEHQFLVFLAIWFYL